MKVKFLFFSILFFLLFISCDDNGIENTEVYSGITETAPDSPDPIGNIDRNDWSTHSYDGIYFGNNFWFWENQEIVFYSKIPNQKVNSGKRFYNSSESIINLNSVVHYPFSVNKINLELQPRTFTILEISYVLPDTLNYYFQDTLHLNFSSGEKYNLYLITYAEEDTGSIHEVIVPPTKGGMYPAYPNPAISNINLRIDIPSRNHTTITIKDNSGKIIKLIVDEVLSAGSYTYSWDLMDENGQKVSPGYYRVFFTSGSIQVKGDIKIE